MAMMNPDRARFMLEPGELVDDTLLSGTPVKLEGPTATAANLVPLGDLSTRMERVQKQPQHNQHRSKENAHPQSLASYGRLSPVRFSPVGETPLPLVRAGSAPALSSGRPWAAPPLPLAPSSLKRSSESMGSSDRELAECKRRLLDHSPESTPPVPHYLSQLLQKRDLHLVLVTRKKKAYHRHEFIRTITGAGILQHEAVSRGTDVPCLPLPPASSGACLFKEVKGVLLEDAWSGLSGPSKYNIARQLRKIVTKMRTPQAAKDMNQRRLGSIYAGEYSLVLDRHADKTHWAIERQPVETQFAKFAQFILSRFEPRLSGTFEKALVANLERKSSLVLSHGNLSPQNIIIDGTSIVWIIGWDCAGWYPDWWEYVKFFDAQTASTNYDWYGYANDIFAHAYPTELAAYRGQIQRLDV